MYIRHLTHACLLLDVGGRRLLVDPGMFSRDDVRGLDGEVLWDLDAILITHQHPDHVDRGLLGQLLSGSPEAIVLAEPQTAAQLAEAVGEDDPTGPAEAVSPQRVVSLPAGSTYDFPAKSGQDAVEVTTIGGEHAIIHPDIPRIGNTGFVVRAGDGPRLGVAGDSLEPEEEFHGIDALAFALVAPWSKVSETIEFLRAVRPRLALPVHDATVREQGRAIWLRMATGQAPEGTTVRDWPEGERVVELSAP